MALLETFNAFENGSRQLIALIDLALYLQRHKRLCWLSMQKVRSAIAATYYADLGIEDSDIFVSDGAKCDISRLQVPKELASSLLSLQFMLKLFVDKCPDSNVPGPFWI